MPDSQVDDQFKNLKSSEFGKLPKTTGERFSSLHIKDYVNRSPDAREWFDPEWNRKLAGTGPEGIIYSTPRDPRYQQAKMARQCFDYYVDHHRCLNLLGKDHEPCKFFRNTYMDKCPSAWINQFDDWQNAGVFPRGFDR